MEEMNYPYLASQLCGHPKFLCSSSRMEDLTRHCHGPEPTSRFHKTTTTLIVPFDFSFLFSFLGYGLN